MLSKKEREVLFCLAKAESHLGLAEIAKLVNTSTRSVSRYIKSINQLVEKDNIFITFYHGKGYKLTSISDQELDKFIDKLLLTSSNFDSLDNLMILTIVQNESITVEKMSELLNYSQSTLTKKIKGLRSKLTSYELQLISKPYYGLIIEGKEKSIRNLLVDYGFEYYENQIVSIKLDGFSENCLEKIKDTVLSTLSSQNIVISDVDLTNLISRIIVSINRQRHGISINSKLPLLNHNFKIVKNILSEIEKINCGVFNESELIYIATSSGFMSYSFNEKEAANKDIIKFIEKSIKHISNIRGRELAIKDSFVQSLAIHINILLHRSQYGVVTINPMLQEIKIQYPVELDYAILLAKDIEEEYQVEISEDEIGYLTIYFGLLTQSKDKKMKVTILCNYGLGTSQIIQEKIHEEYVNIDVIGIYPIQYIELAQASNPDLIISSINIPNYNGKIPLVVVKNLFTDNLDVEIREILKKHNQEKSKILSLFREELFFKISETNKTDVLKKLFEKVNNIEKIHPAIFEKVLDREKITSTDIGNLVAIPHTIYKGDFKSSITVAILDEPIDWASERVQLVMLILFNDIDTYNTKIFRSLYKYFKSAKKVNELIASESFDEFYANIESLEREKWLIK